MNRLYIDMDGVLARFEQAHQPLKRFAVEGGFFYTLEPTKFCRVLNRRLEREGAEGVYILTSSPNKQADKDKIAWIEKHVPMLADRVICVRSGEAKAQYANEQAMLLDDYTENLEFWVSKGGKACKALNGLNGKTKRYKEIAEMELVVD